ncbi:MAG: UvrD-helicase domain-containing protein [Alcaligenaceae bacterium]|nr:UvrD-helicase domain-containing protein [Alcaligenaceae bacterium]
MTALQEDFIKRELFAYQALFDRIEKQPLSTGQRTACVSNALNTLVLAGAGTGKTSTLAGRAAYLLASGKALPGQILMLAFAKEAATEMAERMGTQSRQVNTHPGGGASTQKIEVRTFHSLGLNILKQVEGSNIGLSELDNELLLQAFLENEFYALLENSNNYARQVLSYFDGYEIKPRLRSCFSVTEDYEAYLRQSSFRTFNDDYVKNISELQCANALALLGIRYSYRAHYYKDVYIRPYEPYRCCFYLPDHNCYIEIYDVAEQQISQYKHLWHYRNRLREIHRVNQSFLLEFYENEASLAGDNPFTNHLCVALNLPFPSSLKLNVKQLLRSSSRLTRLLNLLYAVLQGVKSGNGKLAGLRQSLQMKPDYASRYQKLLLELVSPLLQAYEAHLHKNRQIDYETMIGRAEKYVKQKRYKVLWTDILIDEFQDMSASRYALIKAIREQNPAARLFCVGDDWQAIYRFAGSDIRYTSFFESWFGKARCVALCQTFRFNNRLAEVASRFVLQNPAQIRKNLTTVVHQQEPAVSLLDEAYGVSFVLENIRQENIKKTGTVLILSRFRHLLLSGAALAALQRDFPGFTLRCETVHASKGKEADYVIVLGLHNGEFGFPSGKQNDIMLEALLPEAEGFVQAEERRLFYVALTRARQHVYLLYPANNPSVFVTELLSGQYAVRQLGKQAHKKIARRRWL